jgi:cobalt-zinc-cadmium efflux system membrane fusion protein
MPGELMPNEDRTVRLSAPARARIIAVHAEVGDHITPGQVLVRLQGLEAATARAEYAKALADLQGHEAAAIVATAARERAERLLVAKAGSRQDAERARADDELAQAGRRQAQAEVERGRAALEQLGIDPQSGEMHLRSSLAGVVLTREAVPGAVVDAGTPLVVVADLGTLWLHVNATEAVASALRPGSRLRFAVPAYPSDTFETKVTAVAGAVDATTRTVAVRALVSNASRRLRPAMFATVWADTRMNKAELVVPDRALQLLDERPVLFIASPDGGGGARFERRDVEVGSRAGGRVQISSGLEPDALVVTDGAFAVKSEFARTKIRSES